eukprot:TRINITY_DN3227_c0_g1_i1.p1 TRINITY_DN3227_c0_g1~~TRINITY_DN3227_c0_g1_i1.p1  ORF type:complete len:495 (-),score=109.47 TRINITY_DN3227_c0_g1_i1:34-1518(-)
MRSPFFVVDLATIVRQFIEWKNYMPRVAPFYAMKCNPTPAIVKIIARLGCGFDCASQVEVQTALEAGVPPERIIYAHPIKPVAYLLGVRAWGVKMMTFDNSQELRKVARYYPGAELVLRIRVDDSFSLMRFGVKFGADPRREHVLPLLREAKELGINVIGISFHVGSGCMDAEAYTYALATARRVWDMAVKLDLPMRLIDIGGGFPGWENEPVPVKFDDDGRPILDDERLVQVLKEKEEEEAQRKAPNFLDLARVISAGLEKYFPEPEIRVIAEPGRYFVNDSFNLCVAVVGKRQVDELPTLPDSDDEEETLNLQNKFNLLPPVPRKFLYYVNDGVYGSFNSIIFDHAQPVPVVLLRRKGDLAAKVTADRFYRGDDEEEDVDGIDCAAANEDYYDDDHLYENEVAFGSTVFGPTCDSIDQVHKHIMFPELKVGDRLLYPNMGAYTVAACSTFNGFQTRRLHYVYCKGTNEVTLSDADSFLALSQKIVRGETKLW